MRGRRRRRRRRRRGRRRRRRRRRGRRRRRSLFCLYAKVYSEGKLDLELKRNLEAGSEANTMEDAAY